MGALLEDQIDQFGLLDDSGVVDVALVQHLEEVLGMHVHKFIARVADRWRSRSRGGRGRGVGVVGGCCGLGLRVLRSGVHVGEEGWGLDYICDKLCVEGKSMLCSVRERVCVVGVVGVWRSGEERGRERKRDNKSSQAFLEGVGVCGVVGEWVDESNGRSLFRLKCEKLNAGLYIEKDAYSCL